MKNKKKISASEQRTLWGSRVVIWITMIRGAVSGQYGLLCPLFPRVTAFSCPHLFPEKFSIEHYVELVSGNGFWNLGF